MKKTAIVTGSSRGIGFAIARQLGLDGYNIVMVATGAQEKTSPHWIRCRPLALIAPMCRRTSAAPMTAKKSSTPR